MLQDGAFSAENDSLMLIWGKTDEPYASIHLEGGNLWITASIVSLLMLISGAVAVVERPRFLCLGRMKQVIE